MTTHTWRAALMTVAVLLAIEPGAIAADPADSDPEQGAVVDGAYFNPYFGMRYSLPEGWKPGPQPARHPYGGYYVLSTPVPPKDMKATILIAARDNLFADKPIGDAKAALADLAHAVQEDDTAEAGISSTTIADHTFARLNIEASPLSRVVFATNIRCHAVIFAFTSADRGRLAQLAASLGRLSLSAASTAPVCVRDYATPQTVRRRVEPIMVGPQFVKVPVRIVIGTDGNVKHVRVIRAARARNSRASWMPWRSGKSSPTAGTDMPSQARPGSPLSLGRLVGRTEIVRRLRRTAPFATESQRPQEIQHILLRGSGQRIKITDNCIGLRTIAGMRQDGLQQVLGAAVMQKKDPLSDAPYC